MFLLKLEKLVPKIYSLGTTIVQPKTARNGQRSHTKFYEVETNMNKKFLVSVPVGAGIGTAIYQLLMDGPSHADWYRVATVTLVTFIVVLPIVHFSQKK
ncbi:hypothetical protein [Duganella sp. BuS-21]|uniref:hypothetical protein n=1 Tax=Duganella sp. BuS-21 TaxID=2943848 RepID=UPI0035A74617